jgi:hypothetical protein
MRFTTRVPPGCGADLAAMLVFRRGVVLSAERRHPPQGRLVISMTPPSVADVLYQLPPAMILGGGAAARLVTDGA